MLSGGGAAGASDTIAGSSFLGRPSSASCRPSRPAATTEPAADRLNLSTGRSHSVELTGTTVRRIRHKERCTAPEDAHPTSLPSGAPWFWLRSIPPAGTECNQKRAGGE